MNALDREAIAAADPRDMLGAVMEQPDQLEDALWRVDSAKLEPAAAPGGLVVCGMGGSAIGADLAASCIGHRAEAPLFSSRDYTLPQHAPADALYLCSSYSGNTEETLAAYAEAGKTGARRVAMTTGGELARLAREDGVPVIAVPGGLQPRAAVAYMTVGALEAAALCGAAPSLRSEVEAAAALGRSLLAEWGPDAPDGAEPKAIARRLAEKVPIVYGAGTTDAAATRWKAQLNENAKVPAFRATLPEAGHNEICGYERGSAFAQFASVFLCDEGQHERTRRRIDLTAGIAEASGAQALRVESRGESLTERVLSLVLCGDLASVYLAALTGVDPTPVEVIEGFKKDLG